MQPGVAMTRSTEPYEATARPFFAGLILES